MAVRRGAVRRRRGSTPTRSAGRRRRRRRSCGPVGGVPAAVLAEATLTWPEVAPAAARRPPGHPHRGAWGTCSPRCSTCTAPTRVPDGDRDGDPDGARAASVAGGGARPRAARADHRRPRRAARRRGRATTARVEVTITPTYSGCPAMDAIRHGRRGGAADAAVRRRPRPDRARAGLDHGLDQRAGRAGCRSTASHRPAAPAARVPVALAARPCAARSCGSPTPRELTRFGSTACKALWQCRACARALRPLQDAV